jgi:mannose-6-phosphate isomerase-like protein (cupin superfamily)
MKIGLAEAISKLREATAHPFVKLFEHGSMYVEFYQPVGVDLQTPHDQDELYIITSGSGDFLKDNERYSFTKGDVLFVPAGVVHRFENFTNDFATWVIFYGKKGGEANV